MARIRMQFLLAALWTVLNEAVADSKILLHTRRTRTWKLDKLEETDTKLVKIEDAVGQILPYWDPIPTPDTRKMNNDQNFKIEPLNLAANKLYPRTRDDEPLVQWSSREEDKQHRSLKVVKKHKLRKGKKQPLQDPNISVNLKMRLQQRGEKETALRKPGGGTAKKTYETSSEPFILNAYSVEQQFSKLLSQFDEADFTSEILGRTASYIDIVLFKISHRDNKYFRAAENKYVENEVKENKILFIVHALSPMGLEHLFSLTYESNLKVLLSYYLAYLDKFDIYFIPLANPDGYVQVRQAPYWNKNVAPNAACPGVDVDRNFDVAWNDSEQINSCSQHFPGIAPFSEPESRAVRDILHRMSHKIVAYFHVHSGTYKKDTFKGDAVLFPKGYTDQQSDDDKYIDLKGEIDEAIKNAKFKVLSVTVDTLHSWYGKVSGTSVDYAATVYGIPYAMELVMQLYHDAVDAVYKETQPNKYDLSTMEDYTLSEIWRRLIDVIFTNIHKKLEATEARI